MRFLSAALVMGLLSTTALADGVTVTEIKVPDMPLADAVYPGGKTLPLNLGIGSAA